MTQVDTLLQFYDRVTIWEQVDAFENEVRDLVERFHEEFDIPVSCVEGVLIQVGREFALEKNIVLEAELPDDDDENDFLGIN